MAFAAEKLKPSLSGILKHFDSKKDLSTVTSSPLKPQESDSKSEVKEHTDAYYELATDFYEYGWGEGFHFANLFKGESWEHSLTRYECKLALKLGLKQGDFVLVSIA
jgi:hypothetical protein